MGKLCIAIITNMPTFYFTISFSNVIINSPLSFLGGGGGGGGTKILRVLPTRMNKTQLVAEKKLSIDIIDI